MDGIWIDFFSRGGGRACKGRFISYDDTTRNAVSREGVLNHNILGVGGGWLSCVSEKGTGLKDGGFEMGG